MRRRRKNGRRLALAMLILLLAAGLGLLTIRFQRIFMEYAVNVCEDSAIKEINTLMEDEVFSHPDEFADLVCLSATATTASRPCVRILSQSER